MTLTIPANVAAQPDGTPPVRGTSHNGSAQITFKLSAGTFMSNITGLMWNNGTDDAAAPGTVATIVSGGRAGEKEIVIEGEGSRLTETTPTVGVPVPKPVSRRPSPSGCRAFRASSP